MSKPWQPYVLHILDAIVVELKYLPRKKFQTLIKATSSGENL